MIAFGFNICFKDEPSLDDGTFDRNMEAIDIIKSDDPLLFEQFSVRSEYNLLSGREARYGAASPYAECEKGCLWGVEVKDLVAFAWVRGEHILYYRPCPQLIPELLRFWVLHTILPMMFSLDRTYSILHVGAVEVEGAAVIFSAESFGGKSTLTDYFIRQGHALLSDDTLGVYREDEHFMAVASYPFYRPYREAESLGYRASEVSSTPKMIKGVYLLEPADAEASVSISPLYGVEKYRALHFSTFIDFDFLKEQTFKEMSAFVKHTAVYRIVVPWDLGRLSEVYEMIVEHCLEEDDVQSPSDQSIVAETSS